MKRAFFFLGKVPEFLFLTVIFAPFALLLFILLVTLGICIVGMLGIALIVVLLMAALLSSVTSWPFWLCAVFAGFIVLAVLIMQAVTISADSGGLSGRGMVWRS